MRHHIMNTECRYEHREQNEFTKASAACQGCNVEIFIAIFNWIYYCQMLRCMPDCRNVTVCVWESTALSVAFSCGLACMQYALQQINKSVTFLLSYYFFNETLYRFSDNTFVCLFVDNSFCFSVLCPLAICVLPGVMYLVKLKYDKHKRDDWFK